jgi:pimeloyl-ACP methyl ester carboxylesterase
MGGIVAFDLAARYRELPAAVVMLDAAVVLPSWARTAISHFLEELRGPDYREALRRYVANSLFIPTDHHRRNSGVR